MGVQPRQEAMVLQVCEAMVPNNPSKDVYPHVAHSPQRPMDRSQSCQNWIRGWPLSEMQGRNRDYPPPYMSCPHNRLVLGFLNRILKACNKSEASWKQFLLGDSIGCSTGLWNTIRACFIWHIWLQRNAKVFGSDPPPLTHLIVNRACTKFTCPA